MSQPDRTHKPPLDQVELTDGGSHPTATGIGTVSFVPGSDTPVVAPASSQPVSSTGPTTTNVASQTRYEVHKHLGSGSFGSVSLAWDNQLQREVAIKRPRAGLPAAVLQSFLREAQLVARLRHPSVVVVHDVQVTEAGEPFIVYEYLPGQSLRQRLKANEHLPLAEAISIATALAEGLAAAHKLGLTHRDLKPANVLFDAEGRPHIADFGLAVQEGQQQILKGEVAGTYKYMAPEQVRGEAHQLDGRTDLWALGIILYEMLTGRQPFTGDNPADITDQILHRDPRPPRQWVPEIPKDLEQLILKLLAKPLAERYSAATEVAEALRGLKQKLAVPLHQPQSDTGMRIRFLFPAIAFAAVGCLAIIFSSLWMFAVTPKQQLGPVVQDRIEPVVLNDEYFPVGAWTTLMRQRPPGALPIDKNTVILHEPFRARVESEYPEFLILGETQSPDYSYKVRLTMDENKNQAGIFIGLGADSGIPGQDSMVLLKVVIDGAGKAAIEPTLVTLQPTGKQVVSGLRQLERTSSIVWNKSLLLQVDVSDGVIAKVTLDDREMLLAKNTLNKLRTKGNFGIYNQEGSHTFSETAFRRR